MVVEGSIESIVSILVALVMAIIAWWQNQQKKDTIAFYTDPVNSAPVMAILPTRSWVMSDATKKWILAGENELDQRSILGQVAEAEADQKVTYQINYSRGGYQIEYGLIKSSWRS